MAEYIEREALLKKINRVRALAKTSFPKQSFCVSDVLTLIYTAPTADVVEVRHGHWVEENDGTHSCSECGHDATYTYDGTEICGIGCPFCYALMDGKGEGE